MEDLTDGSMSQHLFRMAVPMTALYRKEEKWMLYAVVDDRIEERRNQTGRKNTHLAQVLSGVEEGEINIEFPNEQLHTGLRVVAKQVKRYPFLGLH